jgi:hypothetical protein
VNISQSVSPPPWAEELPQNCPPATALPFEGTVMRLSKTPVPDENTFKSYAALKIEIKGDVSPCHHASCSVFQKDKKYNFGDAIRKLPRFKKYYTHIFFININKEDGVAEISRGASRHIHLWFYATFNPIAAIISTEVCDG